jgi:hypothetical protein
MEQISKLETIFVEGSLTVLFLYKRLLHSAAFIRKRTNISCTVQRSFANGRMSPAQCGVHSQTDEHLLLSAAFIRKRTNVSCTVRRSFANGRNLILLGSLLIFGAPSFAQTPTALQGSVVSETGEKVEFYTLILQSTADSSMVSVEMFSDSVFRFTGIKPQTYILRLQDIQYQPYDTLITVVEGTNVLKTPLVLKPKTLGEVVVRGSRPVLKYNHGNITVDVANSYLKDDINVTSLLGKLPGLIVDNQGSLKMFGKQNLLIYINDMKAHSGDEFKALQPGDIDKIEIIRNVGSEYDINVDAVIKIRTKKRREEKFHISLNDELYISPSYSYNSASLSLYLGANEKISQYITLGDYSGKSAGHNISHLYTYLDDYTHLNIRDDNSIDKSRSPALFYSVNWSISKDKELGVQYSGRFSNADSQTDGTRFYDDETTSRTVNLNDEGKHKANSSTINLNYKQKINNTNELSVVADYVIKNQNSTSDIKESSGDWIANNIIGTDNAGRVFSVTPDYKITGKKFTYNAGLKYSYLNSKSTTEFRPSTNIDHTRSSEHLAGAYMIFSCDLPFINIKTGVRTEYTNSDIQSDDGANDMRRDYFNVAPHISLNSELNEHISLTTYYKQMLQRPSIGSLNSTVVYRDSLLYLKGNPHLKTAITDVFGFSTGFYKFYFSLEYKIYRDAITSSYVQDSEGSNRIVDTYGNMKEKYNTLTMGLSYSFNHPVFTNMTSINYSKQLNLNMPFRGEIISLNEPKYYFQTSGNVNIFKNTSLHYSYRYNNGGDSGYVRYKPQSKLQLTVAQYLMDKKLLLSFSVEDIFNKNQGNNYTEYNNSVLYTQNSYVTTRGVTFYIRYNWGVKKSIQQKRSDTDHIGRL